MAPPGKLQRAASAADGTAVGVVGESGRYLRDTLERRERQYRGFAREAEPSRDD